MNPWLEVLLESVKEGVLLTAIDVPVSLVIGFLLGVPTLNILGFLLLIESVVLMLLGGSMELGGTASAQRAVSLVTRKKFSWSIVTYKKVQARGAFYTIIGVMFFLESLTLALVTTVY